MYNDGFYGTYPYGFNNGGGYSQFGSRADTFSNFTPGFLLAGLTFFIIYMIALWVFKSVGLYHMAKERGIAHAWFAWIPFLDWYIIGELINQKMVLGTSIVFSNAEFILPTVMFVASSVALTREMNWATAIISSLTFVLRISAYWRLYKIYRPQSRASFTVWSTILGAGFFIFAIRNDKPFDELEPNKVYEDYYGQKRVLEDSYRDIRSNIEQERQESLEQLQSEYEQRIDNPNLTTEDRKEIRKDYREVQRDIRQDAEDEIHAARDNYDSEVSDLEQEVLDHDEPESVTTDVIITPIVEPALIEEEPAEELQTDEIFINEGTESPNEFSPEDIHKTIEAINNFKNKTEE